jgi:hypothetical protein
MAPDEEAHALALAREVERLERQRSLWPGFEPLSVPLAVYDGERTYLFRHPAPPDGFAPMGSTEPAGYAFEGRHPSVTANTSADIGGRMTGTLLLDHPGQNSALTDLAALALHEAFHVYQRERHPTWQANEGDLFVYPTDDARLLAVRRLETEALRRALEASDSADVTCWAQQALGLRRKRFAQMEPEFAAYERGTELNEGLAAYIELRAAGRETVVLPRDGFGASEVRRRAYVIGPALALLLDQLRPSWASSLEEDDKQHLEAMLEAALEVSKGGSSSRCAFSTNEVAEVERVAREDVAVSLAGRTRRRAEFEAMEGWRVVVEAAIGQPLFPQGFDPLNVERVEGGVLHTRFLRLSNGSGQLEAMGEEGIDIDVLTEAVGPHPLFNGVQRVVIVGLPKPAFETEAGLVSVRAPGFKVDFENASLRRTSTEVFVQLQPAD